MCAKMSQLHAELEMQAHEKGYDGLAAALDDGAVIIDETLLVRDDLAEKTPLNELREAHEAWLKEKDVILGDLKNLYLGYCTAGKSDTTEADVVRRAIEFIQKGEQ